MPEDARGTQKPPWWKIAKEIADEKNAEKLPELIQQLLEALDLEEKEKTEPQPARTAELRKAHKTSS